MKYNITTGNQITYKSMIVTVTNVKRHTDRNIFTVASYQAVEPHHLVATCEHRIRKMATEKPCHASDEDFHCALSITSSFSPRPASDMNI